MEASGQCHTASAVMLGTEFQLHIEQDGVCVPQSWCWYVGEGESLLLLVVMKPQFLDCKSQVYFCCFQILVCIMTCFG
jgi:hypothetical protein